MLIQVTNSSQRPIEKCFVPEGFLNKSEADIDSKFLMNMHEPWHCVEQ